MGNHRERGTGQNTELATFNQDAIRNGGKRTESQEKQGKQES